MRNLIIGAGPGGLAVAGRFRKANEDFVLLEKSNEVAHSWHNHYHRLHLHTVKKFSELPFQPFPKDYPLYVPREKLVEYYEAYAKKFDIKPTFGKEVTSIKKQGNEWVTTTAQGDTYRTENIIVATGFNNIPKQPKFKNEDIFEGKIMHSRDYRTAKDFKGRKVLVVGMGNTGAEIALDLQEQGAQAFISIRSAINIVPRDFLGRSVQETAVTLSMLPMGISDKIGQILQGIMIGDLEPYGIKKPKIAPAAQLRNYGKTPIIDLGTVREIKNGNIKVLTDVEEFTKTGVCFKDGKNLDFDVVVLCTGYRTGLTDMIENANQYFDELNVPKQAVFTDGMHFVGFDAYSNGGILFSIFNDSKKIVNAISSH